MEDQMSIALRTEVDDEAQVVPPQNSLAGERVDV